MAKRKPKADDEAQKKRFIEKARELGADETGEAFERAFKKIVPQRDAPKASRHERDKKR